jgi:hypothetical protein
VIWKWPSYAYLEKHNDNDDNDFSNDMLSSNAKKHTTARVVSVSWFRASYISK